jgi:hypothetical protein
VQLWEPDFVGFASIMFGVVFALPGLYIVLRSAQSARATIRDARVISATLSSWTVRPVPVNRRRSPLAVPTYAVELQFDEGSRLREDMAIAYRGVRKSVSEFEEGRVMDLVLVGDGEKSRPSALRWPNGKWFACRGSWPFELRST